MRNFGMRGTETMTGTDVDILQWVAIVGLTLVVLILALNHD